MEVIELECPSCEEELEIDAGFAGGVCRCSSCGTLMTVPEDAADGVGPETLARPDRPDAPVQIDLPGKQATRPVTQPIRKPAGGAAKPDRNASAADKQKPQYASMAQIDLGEGNVLITKSGRRIVVDGSAIPTAGKRRRPIVRALTYLVFIVILGAIVLVPLIALTSFWGDSNPDDDIERVVIDHTVNPLLAPSASLLGMPLASRSTIVIDASGYSQPWLDRLNRALQITLAKFADQKNLQVIYWTEGRLIAYPRESHQKFGRTERGQLQQIIEEEVFPIGGSDLVPMVTRAARQSPLQIIIVTGQRFSDQEIRQLSTRMQEDQIAVPIDVIAIGAAESPELQDFVKSEARGSRPGLFVPMNQSRLSEWIDEWENAQSKESHAEVFELPAMPPLPPEELEDTGDDEAAASEPAEQPAVTRPGRPTPLPNADISSAERKRQDEAAEKARLKAEADAKAKAAAEAKAAADAKAKAAAEAKAKAEAEAKAAEEAAAEAESAAPTAEDPDTAPAPEEAPDEAAPEEAVPAAD